MSKFKIAGVKIDRLDFNQVLLRIEEFIKSKKPHQIATVNPEFVVTAQKDKEFKRILNQADICLPDGIGIVLASKLLGRPAKQRVSGTDLIPKIARLSAKNGYLVYFLGAAEGIAKKTASLLKKKYPKLKIAGTESGTPYDLEIIEKIRKAKPDVLFVAFGHPKQEKWIAKYKERLNVAVCIGVGGAFDYISQKVPRAPAWMRNLGFEWLYRLIVEPWRWKRQLSLFAFTYLVLLNLSKKLKIA